MQALTEEDALMEKRIRNREFDKRDFALYSYKYRGHYADQIRNYLQYFNPDQIYSASTEAVFTDPVNSLNKMFAFLSIRQEVNLGKVHPINTGYNKESVEGEVYEYLEDYFKPLNEDLYHLIGKRFSWQGLNQ